MIKGFIYTYLSCLSIFGVICIMVDAEFGFFVTLAVAIFLIWVFTYDSFYDGFRL